MAVAVVLVAGITSAVVRPGHHDSRSSPAGARKAAAPPGPGRTLLVSPDDRPAPGASALERALPELLRFVQSARGLAYTQPVKVTLLGDRDFRKRLRDQGAATAADDAKQLRTTQRVLQAYGLLGRDVDLVKAAASLFGDAVAGFYDPKTDELVVRGEKLTPGVRVTLVHELTHALQDQHFQLDRPALEKSDDESSTGFTGLVEGDAVRIEDLYRDSLPEADQKKAEAEDAAAAGGLSPDVPHVLIQLVAFPYVYGPRFATAVVAAGGQARLDDAFVHPPTTSEQLLHPDLFLAGQGPAQVATPPADGEKVDEGVLGELGLILVLNEAGSSGVEAAAGWGVDRYIAWKDGDKTCVRTAVAMDTPKDTNELRASLNALAAKSKAVKVEGTGPLTFTSCG